MKGNCMKFISNSTVKCLIIIVFISSSLPLLSSTEYTYEGKVIEITEEEETGWNAKDLKTSSYLKFPDSNSKWITWIIQPGVFVKEGTKLVESDHTYKILNLEIAKKEKKLKQIILEQTKTDMERYQKLLKTSTVSEKAKEEAEKTYYTALENYKLAEQNLIHADTDLVFCDIGAPYDCYVDKVYLKPKSVCDIDYPIMKLIRLSPLYVDVKMDRSLAKKIYDRKIGVSVFPMGSTKPVGVYSEKIVITEDGVRLPVKNYIIDDFNKKNMPLIHEVEYVSAFESDDPNIKTDELGILENSLYKDSKGTYVWKAVGQKASQPGKTIDETFPVEKIYVDKTDVKREGIDGKLCKITNADKLDINDILIKHAPEELKDGDKVMYKRQSCLFWPEDTVKVVLNKI
jgi:hypothetical protein